MKETFQEQSPIRQKNIKAHHADVVRDTLKYIFVQFMRLDNQ